MKSVNTEAELTYLQESKTRLNNVEPLEYSAVEMEVKAFLINHVDGV